MIRVKKAYNSIKDKKLLVAFIMNTAFLLFSMLFCVSKYEVSDDFVMENILSGAMGGEPNSYILFVNIILSLALKYLYILIPGVSWYYIFMLLLSYFSFIIITYVILKKVNMPMGITISILFISFFMDDLYILPQFTKTAMLSICAGLILIFHSVIEERKRLGIIIGIIFCVLGSLLRFECFFIAAFFGSIMWLIEMIRNISAKNKHKDLLILLIILLISSAAIVCLQKINIYTYEQKDNYKYYYDYSRARSRILDYKDFGYDVYAEDLGKIGISYNDYLMIRKWNFADTEVFDLNTMQKVGDIIYNYHRDNHLGIRQIYDAILERKITSYPIFLACIILAVIIVMLDYKRTYLVGVACLSLAFGLLLMYLRNRIVYRVEFCLFLGAFLLMMYLWASKHEVNIYKVRRNCIVLTIIFCIRKAPFIIPDNSYKTVEDTERKAYIDEVFIASENYDGRKYRRAVSNGVPKENLMETISNDKNNFYFLDFSTTIQTLYYDYTPIESSEDISFKNCQYLAGISSNHPDINKKLKGAGIDNPMKELVKDNVYLVDNNSIDMKLEFLKQHYYNDVKVTFVKEVEGYKIWKFTIN